MTRRSEFGGIEVQITVWNPPTIAAFSASENQDTTARHLSNLQTYIHVIVARFMTPTK
jgi:hypothetical protein